MIPTMYLRQIKRQTRIGSMYVVGLRTQQWWTNSRFWNHNDARCKPEGEGEWRDIPIVEDV